MRCELSLIWWCMAFPQLTFAEMYADLFRDLLHKVATCTQSHTTFLMALMLRCNLELTNALQTDEAEVCLAFRKSEGTLRGGCSHLYCL